MSNHVSVTCCDEVTVSTTNTDVLTDYIGTFIYNSADDLVEGRKIYKKGDICLYYSTANSDRNWMMFGCSTVGSGIGLVSRVSRVRTKLLNLLFRYIYNVGATSSNCPHAGLSWEYWKNEIWNEDPNLKVECPQSKFYTY